MRGNEVDCDFEGTDKSMMPHASRRIFIYSLLMEFVNQLEKDAQVKQTDRTVAPTQLVRHMQSNGWKSEDYAVQR